MSAPFHTIDAGPLLVAIRATIRRHGIAPSRFGRDAAGDPKLVYDLARGRTVTPRMAARINAQLAAITVANRA